MSKPKPHLFRGSWPMAIDSEPDSALVSSSEWGQLALILQGSMTPHLEDQLPP